MKNKQKLPPTAQQFINSLTTHLKLSSCQRYAIYLAHFHAFLLKKKIALKKLTRKHMLALFAFLSTSGQKSGTRLGCLVCLRTYLRWLYEQKLIHTLPDLLVRSQDFPKTPAYLPRPLPIVLDRKIQQRLTASTSVYHKALLLMRRTGIRVGELMELPYNCTWTDFNDNKFLKVPLGKLNNERNVPLDKKTYLLIQSIQRRCPLKRFYLLPRDNCGTSAIKGKLNAALRQSAHGLELDAPLGTHRLRHSYASTLLCAGLSLPALMKLLGHRDFHMTLRYAGISSQSLTLQYLTALKKIKYANTNSNTITPPAQEPSLFAFLNDAPRLLKKLSAENQLNHAFTAALLKKLARFKQTIEFALKKTPTSAKMAR